MKRPLLGITLAFISGILGEELLNIPLFYTFLSALIFLFLSASSIRSKYIFLLFVISGFFFLGAFGYENSRALPKWHIKNILPADQGLPRHVLVQGRILNRPNKGRAYFGQEKLEFLLEVKYLRVRSLPVRGLLRPDLMLAQVGTRNEGEVWYAASGILSAQVINPQLDFRYADEVAVEGKLSLPHSASNPGQFDYRKYLERKKIFYILRTDEDDFSKITGRSPPNLLKLWAYGISEKIEGLIDKFSPAQEGSILKALLLGERREIDDDIKDSFLYTGTIHILSISGLHVGLLAFIFILLFKMLRFPSGLRAFILLSLLILYCAMVDNRPPVIRATIMLSVFLCGRALKREQDLLNSLAFSALLILFFNPRDLFDIGFQLSFLTVGSIIYFPPRLEPLTPPGCKTLHPGGVKKVSRALIISFSAWLGSAPLLARYFNIVSPVAIFANILIVPWMTIVLASSLAFIILGSISSLLGLVFSEAATFSVSALIKMVYVFRSIPFSYFRVKSPPWIFIIGFYLFLFLFFNRGRIRVNPVRHWGTNVDVNGVSNGVKAKYFLATSLIIFNILVWHRVFSGGRDFLRISFLDVGKGDSIFLEFPGGGTMLIDGGEGRNPDMGRLVVAPFLGSRGINKIDVVMATHHHTDHIGGLAAVLKNFRVRFFMDNGDRPSNLLSKECMRLVRRKRIKRFIVKRQETIRGFDDVGLLVLNPPAKKFDDLNNNSLVLRLRYGDFSILFCADIEEEAVRDLLLSQDEKLSSITVLKVPHHGGGLGDAAYEFIKKTAPQVAVISIRGRDVDRDILDAFAKSGTRVYRTDENGAVSLIGKKDKYYVVTFKNSM